jgi:hypothetical protein
MSNNITFVPQFIPILITVNSIESTRVLFNTNIIEENSDSKILYFALLDSQEENDTYIL